MNPATVGRWQDPRDTCQGRWGLKEMRLGVKVHIISDTLVVLSVRRHVSVWLQKGVRLMHLCVDFLHHASLKGSEICSC